MGNLNTPQESESAPFFHQQEKKKAVTSRKPETICEKVCFQYYEIKCPFFPIIACHNFKHLLDFI